MAFLIDGKKISSQIKDELKNEVAEMKKKRHRSNIGSDPGRQ